MIQNTLKHVMTKIHSISNASFQMKFAALTILCLITTIALTVTEHSRGIVITHKGEILNSFTKWHLNYNISITEFMKQSDQLKMCKEHINNLCSQIENKNSCVYFQRFMDTNEHALSKQLEKVKSLSKRSKRFLTLIMLIYTWIRDWLADDVINQEIVDRLQKADQANKNLTLDHISISNKTLQIHKQGFNKINKNIQGLRNQLTLIEQIQQKTTLELELANTIQLANLIYLNHFQRMETLTKILMNDRSANLLEIIDENILLSNLDMISKELGKSHSIPKSISKGDLEEFLQICAVQVKISDSNIYIKISIPIINNNRYDHFQLTPIPIRQNNRMIIVDKISDHVLINKNKTEYLLLSNTELEKCKHIEVDLKVCFGLTPIYRGTSCELDYAVNHNMSNCLTREIPTKSYVVRMTLTEFMIIPYNKTQVATQCPDEAQIIHLISLPEIISVRPGCIFYNEDFRYEIDSEFSANVSISLSNYSIQNLTFRNVIQDFNKFNQESINMDDTDLGFKNVTEQLIQLYNQVEKKDEKIVVPQYNEWGLLIIIFIALTTCCAVRIGCYVLRLNKN